MKFAQPLHFSSPFGCAWYCTLACDTFFGAAESAAVAGALAAGAAGTALPELGFGFESQPNRAAGRNRLQPTVSAPRSTARRDGVSSFMINFLTVEVAIEQPAMKDGTTREREQCASARSRNDGPTIPGAAGAAIPMQTSHRNALPCILAATTVRYRTDCSRRDG